MLPHVQSMVPQPWGTSCAQVPRLVAASTIILNTLLYSPFMRVACSFYGRKTTETGTGVCVCVYTAAVDGEKGGELSQGGVDKKGGHERRGSCKGWEDSVGEHQETAANTCWMQTGRAKKEDGKLTQGPTEMMQRWHQHFSKVRNLQSEFSEEVIQQMPVLPPCP